MRLAAVIAIGLLAAGCADSAPRSEGGGGGPKHGQAQPAKSDPYTEPAAYVVPEALVARLPRGDARSILDQRGRVLARSMWKGYAGGMVVEWLRRYHVSLYSLPGALDRAARTVAEKQDLTLLILTPRHRRYERVLDRIHPTARELTRFYERFNEERWPRAGTAMLDWLRVLRTSLHAVRAGDVVVLPLSE